LVQSADFFPPLVDDPFVFGQISAANCLSDIYAMGGEPITALNLVAFPDDRLSGDVLAEILKGGNDKVVESGAVTVGGHSVRDAQIQYGLAITGTIDPDQIIRNSTAKPGDDLVLTKPLGSGVLTSARKAGIIAETDLAEAIAVMIALNGSASRVMKEVGVNAATDVTGFGLLGHGHEVAEASDVTIHIEASRVPLMEGTVRLAEDGCLTRAFRTNLAHVSAQLEVEPTVTEIDIHVLADAQTSGGLLISVSSDRTVDLLSGFMEAGVTQAAVIGKTADPSEKRIRLE
jgi:selenide,water dikinase